MSRHESGNAAWNSGCANQPVAEIVPNTQPICSRPLQGLQRNEFVWFDFGHPLRLLGWVGSGVGLTSTLSTHFTGNGTVRIQAGRDPEVVSFRMSTLMRPDIGKLPTRADQEKDSNCAAKRSPGTLDLRCHGGRNAMSASLARLDTDNAWRLGDR